MYRMVVSIACFISISSYAFTDIYEFEEVKQFVDSKKKTLFILDIDNVVLRAATVVGSDQWFSATIKHYCQEGLTTHEAIHKVLSLYCHLNEYHEWIPVESNAHEHVLHLQGLCDHVVCLTARSTCLVDATLKHLKKHSLLFYVPGCDDVVMHTTFPAVYKEGVLFCGLNEKSDVLRSFLSHIKYEPEVIIFVDDKAYNLHIVESVAHEIGAEFIGLRYAGCDAWVAEYDHAQAEYELHAFLKEYPLGE